MGLFDRLNKSSRQEADMLPDVCEFKVVGMRHHADEHDKWVRNGRRSVSLEIETNGKYNGAVRMLGDGMLIGYVASEQSELANEILRTGQYVMTRLVYEGPVYLVTMTKRTRAVSGRTEFIDNSREGYIYNEKYESEMNRLSEPYYSNLRQIEDTWSLMTGLKDYSGPRAEAFKKLCLDTTGLYVRMGRINKKYNETQPSNCPAYKRLAMLYEKQGKYEEAADICAASLRSGSTAEKMGARYIRMLKKAGREPTEDDIKLAEIT